MKNRLIITVSDVSGTKSYNIHQLVRKFAVAIAIVAVLVIGGSFWFISYLNDEIVHVKKTKEEEISVLTTKERELVSQNTFYSTQIQSKVKDIEALSSKLDHLEEIIGLKKDEEKHDIKESTLSKITQFQKLYMFKLFPNGRPLDEVITTSRFGYRTHPVTKKRKFHRGLDIRAKMRTKVYATADGIVSYVQSKDIGAFGRVVKVFHGMGFQTVYAHLNKTNVKIGQVIKKGDLIAYTGNSGRSTAPHLHYEVRYANKVLNPRDFIRWKLDNFETIFKKQRRVPWESLVKLINEHNKMVQQ